MCRSNAIVTICHAGEAEATEEPLLKLSCTLCYAMTRIASKGRDGTLTEICLLVILVNSLNEIFVPSLALPDVF